MVEEDISDLEMKVGWISSPGRETMEEIEPREPRWSQGCKPGQLGRLPICQIRPAMVSIVSPPSNPKDAEVLAPSTWDVTFFGNRVFVDDQIKWSCMRLKWVLIQ
jgi:hypothetical protein